MKQFPYLVLLALWILSLSYKAEGQVLDWQYENILNDTQQSGDNPDMLVAPNGDIYLSAWRKNQDQLMIAKREKTTGSWSFEILDPATRGGHTSDLIMDEEGFLHIAYYANLSNAASLRYAHNRSGNWEIETVFPERTWGQYGDDVRFPIHIQHSIALQLGPSGRPIIAFFDGNADDGQFCSFRGRLYRSYDLNYELDLHIAVKQADGSWLEPTNFDLPYEDDSNCLNNGERFGEFLKFIRHDDKLSLFTNSVHNHKLLMFSSMYEDGFDTWTMQAADSIMRFDNIALEDYRETFGYINVVKDENEDLHLLYEASDLYGLTLNQGGYLASDPKKRTFFYTRMDPDSLGSNIYEAFHYNFAPTGDGAHRRHLSLSRDNNGSLYAAYFHGKEEKVFFTESRDNGLTWMDTCLLDKEVLAPIQSVIFGDSLFLVVYDGLRDNLVEAKRALIGGPWKVRDASIQEESGQSLSSAILRDESTDMDLVFIAYTESFSGTLNYARKSVNGDWSFETIGSEGKYEDVFLIKGKNDGTYVFFTENDTLLRLAKKIQGQWDLRTLVDDFQGIGTQAALVGDSLQVIFFDLGQGSLQHIKGDIDLNAWIFSTIDSSSAIVGQEPRMYVDPNQNMHISYIDALNQRLKYAIKPLDGAWQTEYVTESLTYNLSFSAIKTDSLSRPIIAFRDGFSNSIFLTEKRGNGQWLTSSVANELSNFIGNPLKLLVDKKNKPWVLYNFGGILDEIRLVRRDGTGTWNPVSVLNNEGQISGVFDFHLVENDFYILGKKNQGNNQGLASLFAPNGVLTMIQPHSDFVEEPMISPNPSFDRAQLRFTLGKAERLQIEILDLYGKRIAEIGATRHFPPGSHEIPLDVRAIPNGLYFLRISSGPKQHILKWLLTKN